MKWTNPSSGVLILGMEPTEKQKSPIEYRVGGQLDLSEVIELYEASTLGKRRPTQDRERMAQMMKHANLIITAWDGPLMVGIGRSFTDYGCITYMHCLAVRVSHQKMGIGKEIIRRTQEAVGPKASLLLTAAPEAEKYYPHIGFVNVPQCWILPSEEKLESFRSLGATNRKSWMLGD